MATKELTSVGYVLPRVNLLPPEIGVRKAQQRSYVLMGVAVACAGGAAAAMDMGQVSRVSAAKTDLVKVNDQATKLKQKRAALQPVQDTYATVDANEALLTQAFASRVQWSTPLHNISITIPENVWLLSFTAAASATPTPPGISGGQPSVGSIQFTGKAFAYNDVAAWLDSLARIKGFQSAYVSTATETKPTVAGGRKIVDFSSTVNLTSVAITPHTKPGSR